MVDPEKKPKFKRDKLGVEYDEEDFEQALPNLAKELRDPKHKAKIPINHLKHDLEENPSEDDLIEQDADEDILDINDAHSDAIHRDLEDGTDTEGIEEERSQSPVRKPEFKLTPEEEKELHNPSAEDFIRRCKTTKDAEEIIIYMQKRKEISPQKAEELKKKLASDGLKSFGSPKKWGYYERKFRKNFTLNDDPID